MKISTKFLLPLIIAAALLPACGQNTRQENNMNKRIIATAIIWKEQLPDIVRLAESIRTFGGKYSDARIWAFYSPDIELDDSLLVRKLEDFGVELKPYTIPEGTAGFYYAGKPYAAAEAEAMAAEDSANILVWVDPDTIFLMEPDAFNLPTDISLAYRTVMHNRAGSLYGQPPDILWQRIYELTSVTDDMLFPMTTQADVQKIRAYFHCGILVLRPQKGILRRWADDFSKLILDSIIVEQCRADVDKRVFLHQNALTGAVLNILGRDEMFELSDRYNYPLLFEKNYEASRPFNDLTDVVSMRCVVSAEKVGPEWYAEVKGPSDRIAWLKDRLFRGPGVH